MSPRNPKHAEQSQSAEGQGTASPATPKPDPEAPPQYLNLPPMDPAEMQSHQLIAIAAGKGMAELAIRTAGAPQLFPLLMYNKETRTTKAAKDEKEKADLAGKGFSEEPFPAEDPNAITAEMLQALQDIWAKAGEALKTLIQLVEQQKKPAPPANKNTGHAPTQAA